MIYKKLKYSIMNDFNKYINNNKNENPKVIVEEFLTIIETSMDDNVLNAEETEESYIRMMNSILLEIPELLSYAIGDLFDDLVEHEEDCLAYVFSQALMSYTIRDLVIHYHKEGIFTQELLKALGVTVEILENSENNYKSSDISDVKEEPDDFLANKVNNQKYLH